MSLKYEPVAGGTLRSHLAAGIDITVECVQLIMFSQGIPVLFGCILVGQSLSVEVGVVTGAGGTLREHPAAAIDITVPYIHALWVALVSGDEGLSAAFALPESGGTPASHSASYRRHAARSVTSSSSLLSVQVP